MQKQSKNQETSLRRTAVAFVLAFAVSIATLVSPARAAEDNDKRGFGMTTGVVGIVQTQGLENPGHFLPALWVHRG